MIGAVAVLGYLLVKPFLDSPERARTLSDASPPTPTTVGDGSLADGAPPLSDAALRLDDLPEGWTALADATGPPVGFCEGRNPLLAITPRDELHTSFTKGPQGPFLSNLSLRFATVGEAELFLDVVAQTFETCKTYGTGDSTIALEPADVPKVGDATFAAHVVGSFSGGGVEGDVVWVRHGTRAFNVTSIEFDGDAGLDFDVVALAERIVRRL